MLATRHSTGMAVPLATQVMVMVMVMAPAPEVSTPSNPPNPPTVQIPSACDTRLSLRLLGEDLSDKPCAVLQALVVVRRSRQGPIGGHKCS